MAPSWSQGGHGQCSVWAGLLRDHQTTPAYGHGEETAWRCYLQHHWVCRHWFCGTRPTHICLAFPMPRWPYLGPQQTCWCPWNHGIHPDTVKLNGAHKARNMFSERGWWGWGATHPKAGVCSSTVLFSRWAMGRRHLCCTCICSKVQREWPEAGKARPPRAGAQIQQKFPRPGRRTPKSRGKKG
jgi:hypothetical protein